MNVDRDDVPSIVARRAEYAAAFPDKEKRGVWGHTAPIDALAMSESERLAALLHEACPNQFSHGIEHHREEAARLIARGVRVPTEAGDDGLRAKVMAALDELRRNPTEDAVLDLMDRLDGWASPHQTLVTLGGPGLRAALERIARLKPKRPFRYPSDELAEAQGIARAALAAAPAPTLDRERLARALIIAKPMRSNERFVTYATRIADAYEAEP